MTPGTVDSDYRGEIGVILLNFSYTIDHLQIEGYDPHPHVPLPVAV